MTYKNVVKYIGKKDESDLLPLADKFVVFQECPSNEAEDSQQSTFYCAVEACGSFAASSVPPECVATSAAKYVIPVETDYVETGAYVVDFNGRQAKIFINAIGGKDDYEVSELVLDGKLSEEGKTAMQVIYCIMFWIIFALVIATFVLALLSIVHCGCCRCCNFGNSIFPTRQA